MQSEISLHPEMTLGDELRDQRLWLLAAAVLYVAVFSSVLAQWAADCWELDDFSHCLLIPLVSGVILYQRREAILSESSGRGHLGLLLLVASVGVFFYGYTQAFNVFQRIGALGALVGLVAVIAGDRAVWRNLFPFAYLILAIPVPFVYYSKISIALRGVVTDLTAGALQVVGVPAIEDGNLIRIDELTLGVVDACSGIRSVMAIISVAVLLAYLNRSGLLGGAMLLAFTLPIAVVLNMMRVFTMAFCLHEFGLDLTEGWAHDALGIVVFALVIVLMYASWLFIRWFLKIEEAHA